jgi:hypothetical protein
LELTMMMTMKYRYPDLARAGAILAFLAFGLGCSAYSRADDVAQPVVVAVATPAPERQVVRLPALTMGGIRNGQVMLISDKGTELMKPTVLAQRSMVIPSPFSAYCNPH